MRKLEEKLRTLVDTNPVSMEALSQQLQRLEKNINVKLKSINKNIDDKFRILQKSINSKLENVNKNVVSKCGIFEKSAETKFSGLTKGMYFLECLVPNVLLFRKRIKASRRVKGIL